MRINSHNTVFPLEENYLRKQLKSWEIDLRTVSIRELNRLVDELANQYEMEFLRFEFGIPGLTPNQIGPEEEIRVLKEEPQLIGIYPPFDGVPRLKLATTEFVKNFLNIQVDIKCCIPTVGAMHSGFICQSIAGRIRPESDTILYLEPGFPVNKLQTKFLGLKAASIDLYDYRGEKLVDEIEKRFSRGNIGGLLWSSPNNPSWVCLKEEELRGMGQLLTQYDVIGIEDAAYLGMDYRQDFSVPGQPPFVPTIASYTENYFIIISSSKIFSYAGQRIAVTIIAPGLREKCYPNLLKYYNADKVGDAFIHGGIYPTTACVPQTPQHAMAALFEAASSGKFQFLEEVRIYSRRTEKIKKIFLNHGFDLVYDKDMGEPIGDGFYFTVSRPGLRGEELLFEMLCYGMAGIPLSTTGSEKEGIRICVSLIREDQMDELEQRLTLLNQHLQPNPV